VNIGLLGGSFDPVHAGHLAIAEDALNSAQLDRVIFIPAAQAPLKSNLVHASASHRCAMLRGALGEDPRFDVSDCEITRGGVSYTIDTVNAFHARYAHDALFWIIGADQFAQLPAWREIERLATLVTFIVMARPGSPPITPPAVSGLRWQRGEGRLIDISSTELRSKLRAGQPVDTLMPHNTVEYIRENQLYR
jgi:nicotinate-nucleotide adenylyltransferase